MDCRGYERAIAELEARLEAERAAHAETRDHSAGLSRACDALVERRDEFRLRAEKAEAALEATRRERDEVNERYDLLVMVLSRKLDPDVYIKENGAFDLKVTNIGAGIITEAIKEMFVSGGATNFLTWIAIDKDEQEYRLTIQKSGADTPESKWATACVERDRALALLRECHPFVVAQSEAHVIGRQFWIDLLARLDAALSEVR